MSASIADYFDGNVGQDEFTQVVDLVAGWSGGFIPTFVRELVTRRAKTQTFTFTGVPNSLAGNTSAVTVTDIGGNSYTVPMASSFTDGSSGTKVMETESVQVRRRRLSYHMWEISVTRTGSEYYVNGTKIINGPGWAFP